MFTGGMSASTASRPPALALTGLVKRFGAKIAVDDLHLTVRPGCLFGLVGPNGAGKTTTLSMATGLLRPDAGRAEILGRDVWSDPAGAKALIGDAARRHEAVRPADRDGAAALRRAAAPGARRRHRVAVRRSCCRRSGWPTTPTRWWWSTRPA